MAGRADPAMLYQLAERAEALGVQSVWVGDSLTARPRVDALTTLAAVGARTRRVHARLKFCPCIVKRGKALRLSRPSDGINQLAKKTFWGRVSPGGTPWGYAANMSRGGEEEEPMLALGTTCAGENAGKSKTLSHSVHRVLKLFEFAFEIHVF